MAEWTEHRRGADPHTSGSSWTDAERAWAHLQVDKKRKLRAAVVTYVVINIFLIGLWAFTGRGYFWPGWVLAAWGVLLLLEAWGIYRSRPITEEDIDKELRDQR